MRDRIDVVKQMILSVLIYILVTTTVYEVVTFLFAQNGQQHAMLAQLLANICGLWLLFVFWRRGMLFLLFDRAQEKEAFVHLDRRRMAGWIVVGICGSVVLNDLLAMPVLREAFPSWEQAENLLYGDHILFLILAACITGPVAEELLYRGIVFSGLRKWMKLWPAALLSACVFGLLHLNVLQGIYAGILGILFALMYEDTGTIWMPVAVHMLVNCFEVVLQKTGISARYGAQNNQMALISGAMAAVCVMLLIWLYRTRTKASKADRRFF